MPSPFDSYPPRHGLSAKWDFYDADVLPLWVADMDFPAPQPVIEAMQGRMASSQFGYEFDSKDLREALAARMRERHAVPAAPEDLVFMPGLVFGLNMVARSMGAPGSPMLVPTPVYPFFLYAPANHNRPAIAVEMCASLQGGLLTYELDFDALEAAVTPDTSVFMLCNPHNPVGRAYTRAELEQIAEFCLRHDLILCSDEIHADLLHPEGEHICIAALGPEIAARTITLVAPSKTFNIPGLGVGAAVITDPDLRATFTKSFQTLGVHANATGFPGALAAYTQCADWLTEVLEYLTGNRDAFVAYARARWPMVGITRPEATYLAYLDFRGLNLPDGPFEFFLKRARVALSDTTAFGPGGEGRLRLNYGTSRATLMEALDRMDAAMREAGVLG